MAPNPDSEGSLDVKTYTAVVGPRDGEWFPVEVPEVRGVFTQGRNLVEAEKMAREAIAMMLDVPTRGVVVRVDCQCSRED